MSYSSGLPPSKKASTLSSASMSSSRSYSDDQPSPAASIINRQSSGESNNINIKILKLLKQVENRLCADCDASLGESDVFGIINWGAWVCQKCAFLNDFKDANDDRLNYIKPVGSIRDPKEIASMVRAGNNAKVNSILERYIPKEWVKIKPHCTAEERKNWITAKYESMLFAIPLKIKTSILKNRADVNASTREKIPLPTHVADYFAVVEAKGLLKPLRGSLQLDANVLESLEFQPYISSIYPSKSIDKNNPIPDMISDFVFPLGVQLSKHEKPPSFFTFVLTNTIGVKLYGGVLHVHELLEPEELMRLLGIKENSMLLNHGHVYYIPKALTVISHYGFFNLYRIFLRQIYHISLSAAPLPIERYIAYFVNEVPTPPLGRTQVNYCIAQETLQITRPPRNQLPMVDFSYIPLFTLLSVDNILLIFSCLCSEKSVLICSENISLLTPVCEALLSFLFPFVWQGVYVPIMPIANQEMLEAPIPFLLGMHSQYLRDTSPVSRPFDLVIVDVDNDKILQGIDNKSVDAYLPTQGAKLKSRLLEYSPGVYHVNTDKLIHTSGNAFVRNEHLTPIVHFAAVDGVKAKIAALARSSLPVRSHLGILKSSHISHDPTSPLLCTKSATIDPDVVLDPFFNVDATFNANDIRNAFLRFFVALLSDYEEYVIYKVDMNGKIGVDGKGSPPVSSSKRLTKQKYYLYPSSKSSESTSNPVDASSHSSSTGATLSSPVFNGEDFLAVHDDLFIRRLLQTQMFDKFTEECAESPNQPEIRFFNESILEKMNRSATLFTKKKTPFLDEKSDDITDTYTPLSPSSHDLAPDKRYTYNQFPRLDLSLIGPVRQCKALFANAEISRAVGDSGMITGMQSTSFRVKPIHMKVVLFEALTMYRRVYRSICRAQAIYRMRKPYFQYKRFRHAVDVLKSRFLKHRNTLQRLNIFKSKYLVKVQSYIRKYLARKHYRKLLSGVVIIQSLWRMLKKRRRFVFIRRKCVLIQSKARKNQTIKQQILVRVQLQMEYTNQIFVLWKLLHVPLIYRSYFWTKFDGYTYFLLSMYKHELLRLHKIMGFKNAANITSASFRMTFSQIAANQYNVPNVANLPAVLQMAAEEKLERKNIYTLIKSIQTKTKTAVDEYFVPFGVQTLKRRKHNLCENLLWNDLSEARASALVIVRLLGTNLTYEASGVEMFLMKNRYNIFKDMSIACFTSLVREVEKRQSILKTERMLEFYFINE